MMLFLALAVALSGISVDAAKKLTASWTLCKGADAQECPMGKYGNLTNEIIPNEIPVGSNFTIVGVGYSLEGITSPSMSMRMVSGTLMDTTIFDEACGQHKYIFPLGDGKLYYGGIQCPIVVGPLNVSFTASITSLGWHSDDGTADVTFKLYDKPNQEGNCVVCSVTQMVMTG